MAMLSLKKKISVSEKEVSPAVEESKASKKRRLRKLLSKNYDVWAGFLPLQVGIDKVLFDNFGGEYGRKNIKAVIYFHTRHEDYIANIALGGNRFTLGGDVAGVISEDQVTMATQNLDS